MLLRWAISCLLLMMVAVARAGCPLSPTPEQTSASRLPGDGGYRILLSGEHDKYIPNAVYTVSLQGTPSTGDDSSADAQEFTRFTLSVDSQHAPFNPAARVGFFQIFPDSLTEFNEDCVNTVSESSDYPKAEVQVMWRAPPAGSGCVIFTGMVLESPSRWFAEDGRLSKTFCEMSAKETESLDHLRCCACDEARYEMRFEGIWSNATHPKDFPESVWLTRFSDVVGGTHETNFSFWGREHVASDGFRQLAEWGSATALEAELRAKAKYLRTYIKAPGLWYPNVNSNSSTSFKVDRKHPLLSLASALGPSPDWVTGVSKLNLCQRDCTWMKGMTIDLYPWDAGTDNGISYMSHNSETRPREFMKPITTMYPEDPRSPFYDPTGRPMLPVARLYLDRVEIRKKSCDEKNDEPADFEQVDSAVRDTERPECLTTEYSDWSPCSVNCGKGLRTRTRAYRIPEKAAEVGCRKELSSIEVCQGPAGDCIKLKEKKPVEGYDHSGLCATTEWSDWTSCSTSCGLGSRFRRRRLLVPENREQCLHVSLAEKEKCSRAPCSNLTHDESSPEEVTEQEDPECRVTEWSAWTPCSVSCGKGVKTRSRLLLSSSEYRVECAKRLQLIQRQTCFDKPECDIDEATAKVVCLEKPEKGPCRAYFERWYFSPEKKACMPFIYGGCRGNRNNFHYFDDCNKACESVKLSLTDASEAREETTIGSSAELSRHAANDRLLTSGSSASARQLLAPVDCEVSDWSPWTACDVPCGTGRVTSSRYVTRQPENGGRPCPKRLQRRARCQLAPCDSN